MHFEKEGANVVSKTKNC